MKPLAVGIACLAAGFALGLLVSRRAPETPTPVAAPSRVVIVESPPPSKADDRGEVSRLKARVRELESRPVGAAPDPEAGNRAAAELYAGLTDPKINENQAAWLKMLGRMGELDPSMTPWCVKKYRDARPRVDSVALELAVFSGGPEATALLKEIFGNASDARERLTAGIVLNGQSMLSRAGHSLAVDEELAQLGRRTLGAAEPYERMAGIGLLRFQDTPDSRALLQSLVAQESHGAAKEAAVRALGAVGDRASLEFLHAYALSVLPPEADEESFERTPLHQALIEATQKLKKRFPD